MSKKDLLFLVLLSLGFFVFIHRDINSWYYSAIGDEYAFFHFAKNIATSKVNISFLPSRDKINIFTQNGAYDIVPVAISVFQALVMKLVGINHQGWIAASILTTVFSFFPIYGLAKLLFGPTTARLALLLYAFSHSLWAYNHLGYWNIFGFFPFYAALLFYLLAEKRKSRWLYLIAGIFSGLCFLTNYIARASLLIIGLMLILKMKKSKKNWRLILYYLAGFAIIFMPFFYVNQTKIFTSFLYKSVFGTTEIATDQRFVYFVKNLIGALVSFYHNQQTAHFVSGSLVDRVTVFFFTIGLILMLGQIKKYQLIFISLGVLLVVTGGLSSYPHIGIDRVIFMLPLIAIAAAYGLKTVLTRLTPTTKFLLPTFLLILLTVFSLNYYRFYWQTPRKIQLTPEAVVMRVLNNQCQGQRTLVVDRNYRPLLQPALESYGLLNNISLVKDDEFNEETAKGFSCIVLVKRNGGENWTKHFRQNDFNIKQVTDFSGLTKVIVMEKKIL